MMLTNLVKQRSNTKEYQGVSEKLTICNHRRSPYKWGTDRMPFVTVPFRPCSFEPDTFIIHDVLYFVKYMQQSPGALLQGFVT